MNDHITAQEWFSTGRGAWSLGRSTSRMFSKEYRLTSAELNEIYDAISRRDGFSFVSRAAGFVAEHRAKYSERWDLRRLCLALQGSMGN